MIFFSFFSHQKDLFLPSFSYIFTYVVELNMKSNAKDDKNEFSNANEFGESSEDTSGFIESSSTLNNEISYKKNTSEHVTTDGRLRSRKMQQQVSFTHTRIIHLINITYI